MAKKKTHEEYIKEVAKTNPDIEVIGIYINSLTKILHKCKIDGYEWYAFPSNILKHIGCPKCSGRNKKTQEEYMIEVAKVNPNIEVIGQYVNNHTKILHKCKIDGYEWMASPQNILKGRGCPRCAKRERYDHETYVNLVAKVNPDIEVIGKYINATTKILHKCKLDGYEWYVTPHGILRGKGCPRCAKNERYGHSGYIERVLEINPNIEVLGEYVNAKTPILHKCKIDGYEWMAIPYIVLTGYGCHQCHESSGERQVRQWLEKHDIEYIYQMTFNDCRDIKPLPFDFYLPELNICIEYQGGQHYFVVEYFGGEEKFKLQQKHDNIKREYCKNNNIKLLEIPYFKNVEEELLKLYELIVTKGVAV